MNTHKNWLKRASLAGGLMLTAPSAQAIELGTIGDFKFWLGGYIKLDAAYTTTSDGDLAPASAGRDFYIPGTIPVVAGAGSNDSLDFHAKESRINFKTQGTLAGLDLTAFLEMDFHLPAGGNERVSNGYSPRLRHAFMKVDNFLFGQTWSTFQNVGALAENLDFVGPAEGTIFVRQAQIRATFGDFSFSAENPETTITPNGGGGRIVSDDNVIPDLVARYDLDVGTGGNASLAVIYRTLDCDGCVAGVNDRTSGYGVSAAIKLPIGDSGDDIRAMGNWGKGLGRYVGLNVANGAVIDGAGDLEAIESYGGFVSFRHFWHPQWRSNLTGAIIKIDNDVSLTGTAVTERAYSLHANIIYQPAKPLMLGVEYLYANRKLESGMDGNLHRIQFSAKLSI